MLDFLKNLLTSKKFLATLASIIVWALAKAGLNVNETELALLMGAIATFVLAQGWADKGKEAVKEAKKAPALAPGDSGPPTP